MGLYSLNKNKSYVFGKKKRGSPKHLLHESNG